jgi:hypothetical protein
MAARGTRKYIDADTAFLRDDTQKKAGCPGKGQPNPKTFARLVWICYLD